MRSYGRKMRIFHLFRRCMLSLMLTSLNVPRNREVAVNWVFMILSHINQTRKSMQSTQKRSVQNAHSVYLIPQNFGQPFQKPCNTVRYVNFHQRQIFGQEKYNIDITQDRTYFVPKLPISKSSFI